MAMMQVKKTYEQVNPELLLAEVRDLFLKHGAVLAESKLETYATPGATIHVSRGTLAFKMPAGPAETEQECVRVHIIGSASENTRMLLDVDDSLFPQSRLRAVEDDLDFIFGSYESK